MHIYTNKVIIILTSFHYTRNLIEFKENSLRFYQSRCDYLPLSYPNQFQWDADAHNTTGTGKALKSQ